MKRYRAKRVTVRKYHSVTAGRKSASGEHFPLSLPEKAEGMPEDAVLTRQDIRGLKRLLSYHEKTLDILLLRNRPWRVIMMNLLSGMAKGFGIAIGVTVIAFIAFKILASLDILGLPYIGDFIAELLDYIQTVRM